MTRTLPPSAHWQYAYGASISDVVGPSRNIRRIQIQNFYGSASPTLITDFGVAATPTVLHVPEILPYSSVPFGPMMTPMAEWIGVLKSSPESWWQESPKPKLSLLFEVLRTLSILRHSWGDLTFSALSDGSIELEWTRGTKVFSAEFSDQRDVYMHVVDLSTGEDEETELPIDNVAEIDRFASKS